MMEKDFKSLLQGSNPDGQLANGKSSELPLDSNMPRIGMPCTPACACADQLLSANAGQVKQQPHGWFYCLPRFRRGLKDLPEKDLARKFPGCDAPDVGTGSATKQFLVFDQTGDKTTLIYSSGIGTPVPCLTSLRPLPYTGYNLSGKETGTKMARDLNYHSEPNLTDEDCRSIEGSEMHEDTEEINALLYSDDEEGDYADDDDDDEEASTGHSPSIMTVHDKQDMYDEEEVASSTRCLKRKRLPERNYNIPSLTDTASSGKPKMMQVDDDAESSSAGGIRAMKFEDIPPGNKRSRKERIRETVSILQGLIPDGKNKDAIVVIEEAISYLRTLRLKALSLGLAAL